MKIPFLREPDDTNADEVTELLSPEMLGRLDAVMALTNEPVPSDIQEIIDKKKVVLTQRARTRDQGTKTDEDIADFESNVNYLEAQLGELEITFLDGIGPEPVEARRELTAKKDLLTGLLARRKQLKLREVEQTAEIADLADAGMGLTNVTRQNRGHVLLERYQSFANKFLSDVLPLVAEARALRCERLSLAAGDTLLPVPGVRGDGSPHRRNLFYCLQHPAPNSPYMQAVRHWAGWIDRIERAVKEQ